MPGLLDLDVHFMETGLDGQVRMKQVDLTRDNPMKNNRDGWIRWEVALPTRGEAKSRGASRVPGPAIDLETRRHSLTDGPRPPHRERAVNMRNVGRDRFLSHPRD